MRDANQEEPTKVRTRHFQIQNRFYNGRSLTCLRTQDDTSIGGLRFKLTISIKNEELRGLPIPRKWSRGSMLLASP